MRSLDATAQHRRGREIVGAALCRCGHPGCENCPLTPRTVYLLGAELAWLADVAHTDFLELLSARRSVVDTVFAGLPHVAVAWAAQETGWLDTYALTAGQFEARLQRGRPVQPRSLAEEVQLHVAFQALRLEPDPDAALPPAALLLPKLPGDYAWARAAEWVAFRPDLHVLYDPLRGPLIPVEDRLHPTRWFEPYSASR